MTRCLISVRHYKLNFRIDFLTIIKLSSHQLDVFSKKKKNLTKLNGSLKEHNSFIVNPKKKRDTCVYAYPINLVTVRPLSYC